MAFREFLIDTFAHMPPGRILDGLTAEEAVQRAAPGVHTIAEVVAHVTFWQAWFVERCHGSAAPMAGSAAAGWPAVTAEEWPALLERFKAGLADAAGLGDDKAALDRPMAPAVDFPPLAHYTRRDVLIHLATHNAHHLGQIVLLRQLIDRWPPPGGRWTW
jgi:uncharacterized damage-inducible protein DinB